MNKRKRKQIHRKRTFFVGLLLGVSLVAAYVVSGHDKKQGVPLSVTTVTHQKPAPATVQPEPVNRGLPSQLVIPKLNIDTKIGYVGLDKDGAMETPKNIHDVGWYKYGPLPGNAGSAVIAGHLDGPKGVPGVFADLHTLQKGDSFSVIDSKGQSVFFVVRELRTYGQDEQPPEVFNTTDGVHLNFITCAGTWEKDQRRFTHRLVVFGDQSTLP